MALTLYSMVFKALRHITHTGHMSQIFHSLTDQADSSRTGILILALFSQTGTSSQGISHQNNPKPRFTDKEMPTIT